MLYRSFNIYFLKSFPLKINWFSKTNSLNKSETITCWTVFGSKLIMWPIYSDACSQIQCLCVVITLYMALLWIIVVDMYLYWSKLPTQHSEQSVICIALGVCFSIYCPALRHLIHNNIKNCSQQRLYILKTWFPALMHKSGLVLKWQHLYHDMMK